MKKKGHFKIFFSSLCIACAVMLSGCNEIESSSGDFFDISSDSAQTQPPITDEITSIPTTESETSPTSEKITDDNVSGETEASTQASTTPTDTEPVTTTTTASPPATTTTTEKITTTEPTTEATTEATTESTKPTEAEAVTIPDDVIIVTPPTNSYTPLNYDEQNGMWISYLDLYTIMQGKSESSFRASFCTMLENSKSIGCNTVYVHCRAFSDAYYKSDYYPWTKYSTGTVGVSNGYDPLEIMVEEAHKRGISIHAWINPMRIDSEKILKQFPSNTVIKQWYDSGKVGTYIMKVDDSPYLWLNPAYEEVRALICNGVTEIISKYDVDGVHIDDYFYPTTDKSFDKTAFNASGATNLTEWRTSTISKMVSDMYSAVKKANPNVLFGVSPQGNIDNNYVYMYADVKKWCSESGYLDYIIPQVYFGFTNKWCPFEKTVGLWSDMVTNPNVRIIYGLGVYNLGANTEFTYDKQIFSRQISACKKLANYDGVALYRYDSCFNPTDDVKSQVQREIQEIKSALG